MAVHIIAVRVVRADCFHAVCSCNAVFAYVESYDAARAAADAHIADVAPLEVLV